MDYLYYLGNASLVLRVIEHLKGVSAEPVQFVTVLHQLDGWVVRVVCPAWSTYRQGNLRAFLEELGVVYSPNPRLQHVLYDLENGCSAIEVMQHYKVAVIVHGQPDRSEIESFRQQFIQGLGYCPETLG